MPPRCRPSSADPRGEVPVSSIRTDNGLPIGQRRRTQLAQAIRQEQSVTLQTGAVTAIPGNGNLTIILNGGPNPVTVPCHRHVFTSMVRVGDTVDVLVSNNGMRVIGITGIGPTPSGRLIATTQTVLATNTPGTINLTQDFIAGGMEYTGGTALTVRTTGRYHCTVSCNWQASNLPIPGGSYVVWIYVNGAIRVGWVEDRPPSITEYHGASGADILTLNSGDYIQMVGQQNSGSFAGTTTSGNPGGTTAMSAFLIATQ